jgi:hypothetical protein
MDSLNDRLIAANARIKAANAPKAFNPGNIFTPDEQRLFDPTPQLSAGDKFRVAAPAIVDTLAGARNAAASGAAAGTSTVFGMPALGQAAGAAKGLYNYFTAGSKNPPATTTPSVTAPQQAAAPAGIAFNPQNPAAYGTTMGQGFNTAAMYDVNSPQAAQYMQQTGATPQQYGALRAAAQRMREQVLQAARQGQMPSFGTVNQAAAQQEASGAAGQAATSGIPSAADTFNAALDRQKQQITGTIADAAKTQIMTRDNPYIRQLLAEASVPYMENKFKNWFGDETALGRGAQSIGNLIVGLLSKIPGYEWAVNKGVDMFNPELLSSLGIKTSSHRLPAYGHYVVVGRVAGNDILSRVTRELS